jgi:hypothetical protein
MVGWDRRELVWSAVWSDKLRFWELLTSRTRGWNRLAPYHVVTGRRGKDVGTLSCLRDFPSGTGRGALSFVPKDFRNQREPALST